MAIPSWLPTRDAVTPSKSLSDNFLPDSGPNAEKGDARDTLVTPFFSRASPIKPLETGPVTGASDVVTLSKLKVESRVLKYSAAEGVDDAVAETCSEGVTASRDAQLAEVEQVAGDGVVSLSDAVGVTPPWWPDFEAAWSASGKPRDPSNVARMLKPFGGDLDAEVAAGRLERVAGRIALGPAFNGRFRAVASRRK
jgi:hypothetical protein